MRKIKNFELFSSHLRESRVGLGSDKSGTWPLHLTDSPRWKILQAMGFLEEDRSIRPQTRRDSFLVRAPDGKKFILTKAGYVRTPLSGRSTFGFGREDLATMLFYLIERYLPLYRKKIGRNPTPEQTQILTDIQQIRGETETELGITHPHLNSNQIKFLNCVCEGTWTHNPTTNLIDVQGNVNLSRKIDHPSYRGLKLNLSKSGLKFGHVTGNFGNETWETSNRIESWQGAPNKVDGNVYMWGNKLKTLVGCPSEVGGYLDLRENPLYDLKGAPIRIGKAFLCDEFILGDPGIWVQSEEKKHQFSGEWNVQGWVEVLENGSPEAQRLISTLIPADYWNQELQQDPGRTVHRLASVWSYLPVEIRRDIRIPPGHEGDFELFSGFADVGLF